jgi:hypothetical protein
MASGLRLVGVKTVIVSYRSGSTEPAHSDIINVPIGLVLVADARLIVPVP